MIRNFRRSTAALMIATFYSATPATSAAQTLDLSQNELTISPFGKASTATYGQTFMTAGGFNTLQNFSFWLNDGFDSQNAADVRFKAYIMQWDATNGHATGPVLYSSGLQSGPSGASQRYDFITGPLLLNGGSQYVAFLSASGLFASMPATATTEMEITVEGTYTGGQFVYADNGDDFDALSSTEWDFWNNTPELQTHFFAEFSGDVSVVPEPSTVLLLAIGLSAMLVVAMKKKRV